MCGTTTAACTLGERNRQYCRWISFQASHVTACGSRSWYESETRAAPSADATQMPVRIHGAAHLQTSEDERLPSGNEWQGSQVSGITDPFSPSATALVKIALLATLLRTRQGEPPDKQRKTCPIHEQRHAHRQRPQPGSRGNARVKLAARPPRECAAGCRAHRLTWPACAIVRPAASNRAPASGAAPIS